MFYFHSYLFPRLSHQQHSLVAQSLMGCYVMTYIYCILIILQLYVLLFLVTSGYHLSLLVCSFYLCLLGILGFRFSCCVLVPMYSLIDVCSSASLAVNQFAHTLSTSIGHDRSRNEHWKPVWALTSRTMCFNRVVSIFGRF